MPSALPVITSKDSLAFRVLTSSGFRMRWKLVLPSAAMATQDRSVAATCRVSSLCPFALAATAEAAAPEAFGDAPASRDRKSTRLNSSHGYISYAVFCLKKKKKTIKQYRRVSSVSL